MAVPIYSHNTSAPWTLLFGTTPDTKVVAASEMRENVKVYQMEYILKEFPSSDAAWVSMMIKQCWLR